VKKFLKDLKLFFYGALFDGADERLKRKAHYINLDLLSVILSDEIGIPNPLYYHTVELLPYLASELPSWRVMESSSLLWRALGEFGEP